MRDDRDTAPDRELRDWLRRGDPAAEDPGPDPLELGRMRRRILAAAARRPALGLRLAWGTAGAVALLLVVLAGRGVLLPERPGAGPMEPGTEGLGSGAPGPGDDASTPVSGLPAAPGTPAPAEVVELPAVPRDLPPPSVMAAPAEPAVARAALREVRRARQIQFTAPGGTRIIWTLDPDFKL